MDGLGEVTFPIGLTMNASAFLWIGWIIERSCFAKSFNFNGCFYMLVSHMFDFLFDFLSPILFGDMILFDAHIFQMGWFNHQLAFLEE